jgi:PIN domain nuclease of toxin-antitoxin system
MERAQVVLLLDTHAAIWFATEDESLGGRSRALAGEALKNGRTAIVHRATLATADERLLKWKHAIKRQDARK